MTGGRLAAVPRPDTVEAFLAAAGLPSRLAGRFAQYGALLAKWQSKINLVATDTLNDMWARHFLDSAQLLPLLPEGARSVADLGSGAGFPGLVLALARSDLTVHLVDSDARKMAFLREVAARTQTENVVFHVKRMESIGPMPVDVVVARACAPLSRLLALAAPFWRSDTVALFLKGAGADEELTEALKGWKMQIDPISSVTDPSATILRLTDVSRV